MSCADIIQESALNSTYKYRDTTMLKAGQRLKRCMISSRFVVIISLAFSPDGQYIASVGWDQSLRLYRLADGSPVNEFHASSDGTVRVWEVR